MKSFPLTQLGRELRSEFPIFKNNEKWVQGIVKPFVYLDSAASSQKHISVIQAITKHLENDYGPVHRGAYDVSIRSTQLYEETRVKVANFVSPTLTSEQIIFTKSATEGLNILANGIAEKYLDEKSRIVIPLAEHHANLIPWQQAALKKNCELAYLNLEGKQGSSLRLNLAEAKKLITKNTKLVSFAHVGNVLGQVNPVYDLIEMAKSVGALVVIDCAQSMSCFDDDLFALGADAVVFSSHKMHGPTGIGVLAMSKKLIAEIPPLIYGGGMVSDVTLEGASWLLGPERFEAGSPPVTETAGLEAAVEWINQVGRKNIHTHASALASLFFEKISELDDIEVFSPHTGEETLVSFRHKRLHAHDLATILDAENIAMRAGHHCAWPLVHFLGVEALVRASFAAYSDKDDVFAAVEAIKNSVKFS